MKYGKKATAVFLSAAMLLTALPVQAVYAAEAAASADTLKRELKEAWLGLSDTLDVRKYRLSIDEFSDIYYDILYTEGDWFYVSSGFSYGTSFDNSVSRVNLQYNYSKQDIPRMIEEFNQAVDDVASKVQSGWSDAEKVLYLHDYLAEVCEYDITYVKNDAYSALLGGTTVCQGYALAMCVLCRKVGIPCYTITSDSLVHMWNAVQVDGEWYQCDVTYDDSAPDLLGHVEHLYVLQNDSYMRADSGHQANDWNFYAEGQTIRCTSNQYANAFWSNSIDVIEPLPDGKWLYADLKPSSQIFSVSDIEATLCIGDMQGNKTALTTVQSAWGGAQGFYTVCYVAAQLYGGWLYYNTANEIRRVRPDGSSDENVYTQTSAEQSRGQIYGLRIDANGLLTFQMQAEPAYQSDYSVKNLTFKTIQLTVDEPIITTTTTTTTATPRPTTTTTTTTTPRPTTTTTTTTTPRPTTTTTTTTTPKPTTTTTTTTTITTVTTEDTSQPETTTVGTYPIDLFIDAYSEGIILVAGTQETVESLFSQDGRIDLSGFFFTCDEGQNIISLSSDTPDGVLSALNPGRTVLVVNAGGMLHWIPVEVVPQKTSTTTTTTVTTTTTTTTVTTTTTTNGPMQKTRRGDVNCDGELDVADAVMLARLLAEDHTVSISQQGKCNSDCNDNNNADYDDLVMILRAIAYIIRFND